jgi:hypothetical protein
LVDFALRHVFAARAIWKRNAFTRPASAPFSGIPEKSHLKFAFSGQIRYPEGRDSLGAATSVARFRVTGDDPRP